MEKKITTAFNKKIYLLGKNKFGTNYWLEEPSWDCDWYWGFGYVETYTNNSNPGRSKDIESHQHFDNLFLHGPKCAHDMFKNFFVETTLTDDEIWTLVDYMMTFYNLNKTAEIYKHGYSYQTSQALLEELKQEDMRESINKIILPKLFEKIKELLGGNK